LQPDALVNRLVATTIGESAHKLRKMVASSAKLFLQASEDQRFCWHSEPVIQPKPHLWSQFDSNFVLHKGLAHGRPLKKAEPNIPELVEGQRTVSPTCLITSIFRDSPTARLRRTDRRLGVGTVESARMSAV
jgi:hypothetical protein